MKIKCSESGCNKIYYAEFDTPIVLMENKLKELVGDKK